MTYYLIPGAPGTPGNGGLTPVSTAGGHPLAQRHVLSNGIVALIQRNPSTPTVTVRGDVRIGACNTPAEQAGLALFTGRSLIRGTAHRTFHQIVTETEERGCSVNASSGMHASGFGGKALVEDLPLVLEILADMLINPTFPATEVEKVRNQFLMSLREREQEPRVRATRAAQALLYPAEHPYSRPSSGTIETVQHIGRDDLVAFHQHYHPALTTLAIVGDVEPDAALEELERVFGAWQPVGEPATQEFPPVPPLQGIQRDDIAMEGKLQSDIVWAVHGLKRSDPQYYAAAVGNVILGRLGIGGRLGENVRENQGMAYSIGSSLEADIAAGPWLAIAGVNPANVERAVQAILHEIEHFMQEGPTESELADAQAYLTGSVVLRMETNDGIAGTLLTIEHHNLGLDYMARYPDLINSVSHANIVEVVRNYLSVEHYVLTVAGPPHSQE